MKLFELLGTIGYDTSCLKDVEIEHISQDTRNVKQGSLFICVKGEKFDGHDLISEAKNKGAVAFITERKLGIENEIIVENSRKSYGLLCSAFFSNPSASLRLIAVTGTNGKTTVTSIIKQVLQAAGKRCGLIGTISNEIDTMEIPSNFTTPDAFELNALLHRMKLAGCEFVILEASSQALIQHRLHGQSFEVGVFTNLTQDHLDIHGNMENYFDAKSMLFNYCDTIVSNLDDIYGKKLIAEHSDKKIVTYSVYDDSSDYTAKNLVTSEKGVRFELVWQEGIKRIIYPCLGEFSAYNAMAATVALLQVGIPLENIAATLQNLAGVKGRCEILHSGEYTVLCDYAHTDDGLEKILKSVKPFVKGRLIALFGCAGERDAKKRPLMAMAVSKYSDYVVLTSDNPRGEDAYKIIKDAEPTIKKMHKPYITEADRRVAINRALKMLQKDDMLVLCGKGHEDYQVLDGVTVYLDEHRIVQDYFKEQQLNIS